MLLVLVASMTLMNDGRPMPASAAMVSGSVGVDADQDGTSWYSDQTELNPQLVQGGSFGQLFASQLTGDIQAQPLVEDGVLLAETDGNVAYGLDPGAGSVLWSKSLGTPFSSAALGCSDLPSVGVTGTPVVDTSTNIEYFLSKTYVSGTSGPAQYWMHALSVTTGAEQPNFPVLISGTASNDPNQSFNATYQLQRPGLLLMNGVVYAAFGSHCDIPPTNGWVVGVSEAGSVTTLWSSEAGIDTGNGLGGIWAPGALRSDGPGQLILSTGNGYDPTAPVAGNANPSPGQLAEAVVRLTVQPNGSLKTTDFFIPLDANALNQIDGDLGSGSPVILPSNFSTPKYPELAVEIGKEGYLYVLNAANLGGYEQGPDGGDNVLARLGPVQGVWGSPAVWGGDGGYLYVVTNGGSAYGAPGATDGKLLAFKFGVDGSGNPTFALVGQSTDAFGYSSSSPVVTSSGSTSGTGILWVNWADGPGSTTAQLRAYNPIPDAEGNLDLLWSAPSGASVKLSEPGVADNRIYVGGFDGVLRGYGSPVQSPLGAGSLGFPNTTVSKSSTLTDTLTANTALTVTALSATGPYSLGAPTPSLPIALSAGQTFSVPVTFTPTTYGIAGGVLSVTTSAGDYSVGLSGTGLSSVALLTAAPAAISYEGTAVGSRVTEDAVFTNQGSQNLDFTGDTLPAAPFVVDGLPTNGSSLAPGESVSVSISFSPTATGSFLDALTVTSDTGGSATVNLSGTAGTPALLEVSPISLNYGTVPVGQSVNATFVVTNAGGTPLTINKSKPPGEGEFAATTQLAEGTTIQAGQSVTESVTFTPTGPGTFTDSWPLNGSGNSVLTTVTFTGTGSTAGRADLANWSRRGTAALSGSAVSLTTASSTFQAGSVTSPVSLTTNNLTVAFDATIGGGTGANGMTLTFANPDTPTFLGQAGGSLGYSGISGVAVGLANFKQGADPSANFVGIADGGPVSGIPNWVATSSSIPTLQGATTHVIVTIVGTQLTVFVAGAQALQTTVSDLPSSADIVFTAATGGLTDDFSVQNVNVTHTNPYPLSPVLGGWTTYGNAALAGPSVSLTTATSTFQSGSIVSPTPVPTNGLSVAFDAAIGGGTGANGMTLTFANPDTPTFLGQAGGSLGLLGDQRRGGRIGQLQTGGRPVGQLRRHRRRRARLGHPQLGGHEFVDPDAPRSDHPRRCECRGHPAHRVGRRHPSADQGRRRSSVRRRPGVHRRHRRADRQLQREEREHLPLVPVLAVQLDAQRQCCPVGLGRVPHHGNLDLPIRFGRLTGVCGDERALRRLQHDHRRWDGGQRHDPDLRQPGHAHLPRPGRGLARLLGDQRRGGRIGQLQTGGRPVGQLRRHRRRRARLGHPQLDGHQLVDPDAAGSDHPRGRQHRGHAVDGVGGRRPGARVERGRPPAGGRPGVHRGHRWSYRQLRSPERDRDPETH